MTDRKQQPDTALPADSAPPPDTALTATVPAAPIPGLSARQDFFELLRRIERAQPAAPRLGVTHDHSRQRLQITQQADMAFASREVVAVEQRPPQVRIAVRHFGLFAPYGPLPLHVTEHARSEVIARRNAAFQQFAGLLSQRFAILHYRAWAQLNAMAGHDHAEAGNPFLLHLRQIAGVHPHLRPSVHVQRLRQAWPGAWLPGRRALSQLGRMLTAYFGVPIALTPRYARWIDDRGTGDRQRLGRLGQTRIGSRFFDAQYGVQIRIGPLSAAQYAHWQRGSERVQALVSLCRDFMQHQLIPDVSLLIRTEPDMAARLGRYALSKDGWLKPDAGLFTQCVWQSPTYHEDDQGVST